MACFRPIRAFKCADGAVVFSELVRHDIVANLDLPCGQCIGCRLERSRQWAVRCMHEAQLHQDNCFITLTYDDEHLPDYGTLVYADFQRFMKRLRKFFSLPANVRFGTRAHGSSALSDFGVRRNLPIRFYMCGEYGELNFRPHFHACLFGIDFSDRIYFSTGASAAKVYTSAVLSSLWPFGFASVGDVTFESAAYIARYIVQKITGDAAVQRYSVVDKETGEMFFREPEFNHMSLKPGIGAGWYEKFHSDVYPSGEVYVRGKLCRAPRYYDKRFVRDYPDQGNELAYRRYLDSLQYSDDNTSERLRVREMVLAARLQFLKRSID